MGQSEYFFESTGLILEIPAGPGPIQVFVLLPEAAHLSRGSILRERHPFYSSRFFSRQNCKLFTTLSR